MQEYEALRKDVLEARVGAHSPHGRALLMFKGMATWMKRVGEMPGHDAPSHIARGELRLPAGIEPNLIQIVATMTLATALEGRP